MKRVPRPDARTARVILALFLCWLCWGVLPANAQQTPFPMESEQEMTGEGWAGFRDYRFLGGAVLTLLLATVLGAAIGYHPTSRRRTESLEEIAAPKIYIMYSVVGAIIGIMVLKYGLVIGFVVFGIGGLVRFRSNLRSPTRTGQVIFVTLIGLSAGLDLPHVAILATAFGFVLIYVLDARVTYRIVIKGMPQDRVRDSAERYRGVLEAHGCTILAEKKNFAQAEVALIFRSADGLARDDVEQLFEVEIPESVAGSVDWERG